MDSRDIYTSFPTNQNSIEKSIRADADVVKVIYEVRNNEKMCWLSVDIIFAYPGTKKENTYYASHYSCWYKQDVFYLT